jgi:uracil-DNA glycosylase
LSRARLAALEAEVTTCRRCPRLVDWRERVAREKRAAYRDWEYWGRPIPGFGDPDARLLILGLAPAAHGANRTGRIFTGDRSGEFLFAGLHRAGYANQPTAESRDDGLALTDCFVTAAVRCAPPANRPLPAERDACRAWLEAEVRSWPACGWCSASAASRGRRACGCAPRSATRAATGPAVRARGRRAGRAGRDAGCFHPSQQNTFTGRLVPAMLDDVLARARELSGP